MSQLAAEAVGGDTRALEGLMTALLPRARNLVRYLIGGDPDVDDIAQVALFSVARGLHTFEGRSRFTSWSDRIVARATFAELRARAARPRSAPEWELEVVAGGDAPGAEDYFRRRWLVGLLDQLPGEQRQVVVLHHVMELTVPEIAALAAIPAETVRSRLRLAKARLRSLGAAGGESEDE